MMLALNMELETVRTVLRNDVNEVAVCADTCRDTGAYYTVVSIFSSKISKELAGKMAYPGLFAHNGDFVGSFTHRDALCLVFAHRPENRLLSRESLFAPSFPKRKELALGFLTALAETEITGNIGSLLLTDENVHIGPDGKVYLNYFFDFAKLGRDSPDDFFRDAARYAFGILAREYSARHDGQVDFYPSELRLMFKKIENNSFRSFTQIMAFIKGLSDTQKEPRRGFMRVADTFAGFRSYLAANPSGFFLIVVVVVTLAYLAYQLSIRYAASRDTKENTVFVGMQTIGEVNLGEEFV